MPFHFGLHKRFFPLIPHLQPTLLPLPFSQNFFPLTGKPAFSNLWKSFLLFPDQSETGFVSAFSVSLPYKPGFLPVPESDPPVFWHLPPISGYIPRLLREVLHLPRSLKYNVSLSAGSPAVHIENHHNLSGRSHDRAAIFPVFSAPARFLRFPAYKYLIPRCQIVVRSKAPVLLTRNKPCTHPVHIAELPPAFQPDCLLSAPHHLLPVSDITSSFSSSFFSAGRTKLQQVPPFIPRSIKIPHVSPKRIFSL